MKLACVGSPARPEAANFTSGGTLGCNYAIVNKFWVCPAQNTGNAGYFAAQNSASQVCIFHWGEGPTDPLLQTNVNIATIPTEGQESLNACGDNWLGGAGSTNNYNTAIFGGARGGGQGNELWFAWNGARSVSGRAEEADVFTNPHIGIAIIDATSFKLIGQRYIWNPAHAFAYPALAANEAGEIGMAFMWGGGAAKLSPRHGVGFVSGKTELVNTANAGTISGGNDYHTIRRAWPSTNCFCAGVYTGPGRSPTHPSCHLNTKDEPHYILFGRDGAECSDHN